MIETEAGALKPAGHVIRGNAKPAVGMALAQLLKLMRCKIDDHQPPARFQHTCRLDQRADGLIEIV